MTAFDRRQFLRFGTLGTAIGGAGALFPGRAWALPFAPEDWVGGVVPTKKLLYVFLRGGNDGVNMIYPHGDPAYYAFRDSIALQESEGIDIGSTNCRLHPAMDDLQPLIDANDVPSSTAWGTPTPAALTSRRCRSTRPRRRNSCLSSRRSMKPARPAGD